MTKRVSVRWDGELEFEGTDEGGATVRMSPSEDVYGPSALVLTALAGCTGMAAVSIMTKKKVAFETYHVEVSGEQREDYPRTFTRVIVEHIVTGSSIRDRDVARAIELSAGKYCVVGASLASGDTRIDHRMRLTDERGERTCDCISIGPHGKGLSHYEGDAPA